MRPRVPAIPWWSSETPSPEKPSAGGHCRLPWPGWTRKEPPTRLSRSAGHCELSLSLWKQRWSIRSIVILAVNQSQHFRQKRGILHFEHIKIQSGTKWYQLFGKAQKSIPTKLWFSNLTVLNRLSICFQDFPLNPKSLSLGELYGEFDINTNEWTDGVLSSVMRQTCAGLFHSVLKSLQIQFNGAPFWNARISRESGEKSVLSSGLI